jgi:3-deoxy-7-phosphoheptulonate synthase
MEVVNFHNRYWNHVKLANRHNGNRIIVDVRGRKIGAKKPIIIAGTCSVETKKITMETAKTVKKMGGDILRGGVFKSRTSPRSSKKQDKEKLKILKEAGDKFDLPIITEVTGISQVNFVKKHADIIQIGARSMRNLELLKKAAKTNKPIMLKRAFDATIEEWLLAAEGIMMEGNKNVILCERGIRTFEPSTRNTLDISAIPLIKQISNLPIIIDPSHATGRRSLVVPLAKAGIIAGADGVMIEIHPKPSKAISDGFQSLTFDSFNILMKDIKNLTN